MKKMVLMAAVLLVIAACGGDGDSEGAPGNTVATTTADTVATSTADTVATTTADTVVETTAAPQPAVPGQVEIAVDGITDGNTQILLTMIQSGERGRPMGVSCAQIDGDPWSYSGLIYPMEGDHPCALGTTPIEFEPGMYEAIFGVFTGGQTAPDQCVKVEFEVNGKTTVTAPPLVAPCDLEF